jgi:VWFA-related protein
MIRRFGAGISLRLDGKARARLYHLGLSGLVLLYLFVGILIVCAQQAVSDEVRVSSRPYVLPALPVVRVETKEVVLGVVVRDSKRKCVGGLKQGDFEVRDNGKPQDITYFSEESVNAPSPSSVSDAAQSGKMPGSAAPSASAAAARFVALYFDDIHTDAEDLSRAKAAAREFVKNGVQPGTQVAIFTGSSTDTLAFTDDSNKIVGGIGQLQSHLRMEVNGLPGCPKITPYQAYLIVNHLDPTVQDVAVNEAEKCECLENGEEITGSSRSSGSCVDRETQAVIAKASVTWNQTVQLSQITLGTLEGVVRFLSKLAGQRTLVLASPGFLDGDTILQEAEDRIIDEALHSGIVINSLDAKGLYAEAPGGGVEGLKEINQSQMEDRVDLGTYGDRTMSQRLQGLTASLESLSDATGGIFFHNNNDLGQGFHRLADAPETAYLLAFAPEGIKADGNFHKLTVRVQGAGYSIESRPGYFAPKANEKGKGREKIATSEFAAGQKLDLEVQGSDLLSDVPTTILIQPAKNERGDPILWIAVKVDVSRLQFQQEKDRRTQHLTFVMALFDEKGNFVTGKQGEMLLMLKDATYTHFSETGLSARVYLQVPLGSYVLRTVTQESVGGKMSASSQAVKIE